MKNFLLDSRYTNLSEEGIHRKYVQSAGSARRRKQASHAEEPRESAAGPSMAALYYALMKTRPTSRTEKPAAIDRLGAMSL